LDGCGQERRPALGYSPAPQLKSSGRRFHLPAQLPTLSVSLRPRLRPALFPILQHAQGRLAQAREEARPVQLLLVPVQVLAGGLLLGRRHLRQPMRA
tara:strand:+ start:14810 stop:15100 length:291 start_codon:yes stop_codon:yes gene_type:complete